MIDEFDASINKLLQLEFGRPLPFDVSFSVPDHAFGPISAERSTLNCYLYEIAEDRAFRNLEPHRGLAPGGLVRTDRPPFRAKLSYCVTAWSPAQRDAGRDPAIDEHALLAGVMVALLKHPVLPREVLNGALSTSEPAPTATLFAEGLKTRDFWNAIGGTLRPSLEYSATISIPFDHPLSGPMVTSVRLEMMQGAATHVIGGVVRAAANPAQVIPGAWVRLAETGETFVTDGTGAFRMARLREGTYTIAARAVGFREASREVAVPGGDYDLQLVGL